MQRILAAGVSALILAACQPMGGPDEVDAEALDTIALAVEDELNVPGYAILALLREASQEAQVGWDALFINLTGEPEPVNWWLDRRGFLEMSGAQFATRVVFTLTGPARQMLEGPDEPWFEVEITGEEQTIDCRTAAAIAANGCEVELEVTPALTAAGRAAIGAPAQPLQPITVTAVVTLGPEGWEVPSLTTGTAAPADIALAAILGPPAQREAAARQANQRINERLSVLAGETEPEINLEAWTPPNYIEPPPPVAPIEPPGRIGGRPESPFRPGF